MMKRRFKLVFMGIMLCCFFALAFSGCDVKSEKVTAEEWEAAFDALEDMIGENYKVEIRATQEANSEEGHSFWRSELTGISDGEKEYLKEKRTETRTHPDSEAVTEDLIDAELYLERTEDEAFEYVYENGEWTKRVSQTNFGSIVGERQSEYQRIFWEYFARSYEEVEYSDEEKGYVCRFLSGDGITNKKCTYKLKDKKIVSISAEEIVDKEKFTRKGAIDFTFTYGKQKITLPNL